MSEELFKKIREGSEEEAREAYESFLRNSLKGAVVGIVSRNFSHNVGKVAKTMTKKKKTNQKNKKK
jgi:hypothetical protein